jgi:hypothetical protein
MKYPGKSYDTHLSSSTDEGLLKHAALFVFNRGRGSLSQPSKERERHIHRSSHDSLCVVVTNFGCDINTI